MTSLSVTIKASSDDPILAPVGLVTPLRAVTGLSVSGGRIATILTEAELALSAALITPQADTVTLRYSVNDHPAAGAYPEAAFAPRDNAHTRAASDLAEASRDIAARSGGGRAGIEALVAEAEARFEYAHPKARFTDGQDAVPYLSCGLTEGSCVDINTYLVASLRAAGYEAAYFYGYFFPEERGGMTDDGHCWVATRHAGEVLEWDIAHHIKAGLGPTRPALNPRPGERVAVSHSMGHRYQFAGRTIDLKILGEPMRLPPDGPPAYVTLEAWLQGASAPAMTTPEEVA
ncbi:MAG: transglutaminase family protein [Pseudomonadota bacterium]